MNKVILLTLIAASLIGSLVLFNQKPTHSLQLAESTIPNSVVFAFNEWKQQYNVYIPAELEPVKLEIFYSNLQYIEEENSIQNDYVLAPNQFMQYTNQEFKEIFLGAIPPASYYEENHDHEDNSEVPNAAFDWRTQGKVGPVQNQGSCGSCWAFSAAQTLDGYYAVKKGQTIQSSPQQLVDCSSGEGNQGCNGGWPSWALNYVKKNGLTSGSAYPYKGRQSSCSKAGGEYGKGITVRQNQGCGSLDSDIQGAPTSVAVDASNWSFYSSGVFTNCKASINHAVLAVGYDASGNYYVKNSWGTGWGQSGYITVGRNACGICNILVNAL